MVKQEVKKAEEKLKLETAVRKEAIEAEIVLVSKSLLTIDP